MGRDARGERETPPEEGGGGGEQIRLVHSEIETSAVRASPPAIEITVPRGRTDRSSSIFFFYRYGNPCPVTMDPWIMPPMATIA